MQAQLKGVAAVCHFVWRTEGVSGSLAPLWCCTPPLWPALCQHRVTLGKALSGGRGTFWVAPAPPQLHSPPPSTLQLQPPLDEAVIWWGYRYQVFTCQSPRTAAHLLLTPLWKRPKAAGNLGSTLISTCQSYSTQAGTWQRGGALKLHRHRLSQTSSPWLWSLGEKEKRIPNYSTLC